MTPPEITDLEMAAAIAKEQANAATARASIAALEHQRSLLGSSAAFSTRAESRTSPVTWILVGMLVAFVLWAVTDPRDSHAHFSATHYSGR